MKFFGTKQEYEKMRRTSFECESCGALRMWSFPTCPGCGKSHGLNTQEVGEAMARSIEKWTPEQKRRARESLNATFKKHEDERLLSTPCDPTVN
jgi:hypothetical protein